MPSYLLYRNNQESTINLHKKKHWNVHTNGGKNSRHASFLRLIGKAESRLVKRGPLPESKELLKK
jgi:hypothetical protein